MFKKKKRFSYEDQVHEAYSLILNREPDDIGMANMLSLLKSGADVGAVYSMLANSEEFKKLISPEAIEQESNYRRDDSHVVVTNKELLDDIEQIRNDIRFVTDSWNGAYPELLNSIKSQAYFDSRINKLEALLATFLNVTGKDKSIEISQINKIFERFEFFRKEILSHQLLAHKENEEARFLTDLSGFKGYFPHVNLGAGHVILEGAVNIDSRDLPGIDIQSNILKLPFGNESVGKITMQHVIEHFTNFDLKRKLLPEVFRVMEVGGSLEITVPDGNAMVDNLANGIYKFEHFREVMFGGQEYDGDFHYNLFNAEILTETLLLAGFTDVDIEYEGRANGFCYELKAIAQK